MILDKIFAYKKEEIEHFKRQHRLEDLKEKVRDLPPTRAFLGNLRKPPAEFAIISEVKRKSPSKGVLRENFKPVEIAQDYASHGAAAISVLTDEHFFGGHLDHLRDIRGQVSIPLLRKDFLWESYQVYAAREAGADAILLIAAMLEKSQIVDLQGLAGDLGMDILLEVHDDREADLATSLNARLVGVNNRDLQSFKVDVKTTERLLPRLPKQALVVSESGLDSRKVLQELRSKGVGAFLIGEAFVKAPSPGRALQQLLTAPPQKE